MGMTGGFGPASGMASEQRSNAGRGVEVDDHDSMIKLIAHQKEQLRVAKTRKGQKAQIKPSREVLMFKLNAVRNQQLDRASSSDVYMRQTFINFAYPPCTSPVGDLTPITIADLRLETHHTGKVLFVKTIGGPTRVTAVQNIVEDETGNVDLIAVYNADPISAPESVLPCDTILAIKEPYYKGTADGGVQIRVDHPSDIVRLKPVDPSVPDNLAPRLIELDKTAASFKGEGNAAYARKDYETAISAYTDALQACEDSEVLLKHDLFRNRAMANLCLKRYERALDDALAAVMPQYNEADEKLKTLNNKAYFRAGRAAYELGRFKHAETYYKNMSKLVPEDADAVKELRRTTLRLREASTGVYDFAAMSEWASKERPHLDHASSTEKVEVRDAEIRGRGLFAKVEIKAGELILCEKAFSAAFGNDKTKSNYVLLNLNTNRISTGKHAMLLFNLVKKMHHSPSDAARFFNLYDGDYEPKCAVTDVDGLVAVDTFRAQAIIEQNAFGCPDVRSTKDPGKASGKHRELEESSGVWVMASYANHSCVGNAHRFFIGDIMIIKATKDIAAGQEIFQGYLTPEIEHTKTQNTLQKHWGFKCKCLICTAEDSGSASERRQRATLSKELAQLLDAHKVTANSTPAKPIIAQGERLMAKLREAYGTPAFNNVPKLGLASLGMWLMKSKHADEAGAVIEAASRILQDLGFGLTEKPNSLIFDHTHSLFHIQAVHAAMHAAQAHTATGQIEKSASFERFARELYVTACGDSRGFDERYKK